MGNDGAKAGHRCPDCGAFITVLHMSCPNCDGWLAPAEVVGDE